MAHDKRELPIRPEDIVNVESFASEINGLRILFVNVFMVSSGADWVLVDTGLPLSHERIVKWVEQHTMVAPKCILMTHGHFDHAGSVEKLAELWDVPVYAHTLEVPYLSGQAQYPPPDPTVGGGLMALLSPFYPRGPHDLGRRLQTLPSDGTVPFLPEWSCIHTPGHTEGHVSFFREGDRTLLAGDAFCTMRPESFLAVATQRPELHGPPAYFTTDWAAAKQSVEKLAALRPETVAPGHGKPMVGESVAPALRELAERFEELAMPRQGIYVQSTRP